jgi:hypothetical protein
MDEQDVLDPRQLVRIVALHRGFFYQHLYAAACILMMSGVGAEAVVVERDEDVEIVTPARRIYVQVKTRLQPLSRDDVADALERFETIRALHASGDRPGEARFLVVANVEPSPSLAGDLKGWPADVELVSPDRESSLPVPVAWPDLAGAIKGCEELAAKVPFPGLPADALVLKLAAVAQYAATGHGEQRIRLADLPGLFNQFIVQLQTFPDPPEPYRPQSDEPALEGGARVRLLVGFSGAGKTAWAAHAARLSAKPTVYFDVSELPAAAIASSLGRELAARFLSTGEAAKAIAALPAAVGLELFRHLARSLREKAIEVTIVLDNVHLLDPNAIRSLVGAVPDLRFVMIAQPWPGADQAGLLLNLKPEELAGWSADTIAEVFVEEGARIDRSTVDRLVRLTSPLPLLIQGAARLTAEHYAGDAAAFCAAVERSEHAEETAPEIILRQVFEDLPEAQQLVVGALSLSDVPLARDEVADWISSEVDDSPNVPAALRTLTRAGIVQTIRGDRVRLHDAFRILGEASFEVDPDFRLRLLARLADLIQASILETPSFTRFSLWIRLLARTDQFDILVDLATYELFHERGDPAELYAALEVFAQTTEDPDQKFWTIDALAFWDQRYERSSSFDQRAVEIEKLLNSGVLGKRASFAAVMKVMIAQATAKDLPGMRRAYDRAIASNDLTETELLLLNYNLAFSELKAERPGDALKTVSAVVQGYYRRLGITEQQILGLNPPAILELITPYEDMDDDIRHIGDALDLTCHASERLGRLLPVQRMLATTFYALGNAIRSYIRTSLQLVDDFRQLNQHGRARRFMETSVLPNLEQVPDQVVPVRRLYALVLAETGNFAEGLAEMRKLAAYEMPDYERKLFDGQLVMMKALARH